MSLRSSSSLSVPARCSGLWHAALCAALGVAAPGLALAGVAGVLTTTVTTLATNVTYSTVAKSGAPLVTYIGYEFTTTYTGTNTTNNVQLRGNVAITDPAELATLALDTVNSPSFCRSEAGTTALRLICDLPQLRSTTQPVTFQVFFKAPAKVVNGAADTNGSDFVSLSGATVYAEQSDGAGNTNNSVPWVAPPLQDPTLEVPPRVELGTFNPTVIRSVLPKSGGKLFTGNAGIASKDDLFGTNVTVPAYPSYTKTDIFESVDALDDCSIAVLSTPTRMQPCFKLDLSIVDGGGTTAVFPSALAIKLSIDGSIIPQKVKPSDLTVQYEGVTVGACPALNVPLSGPPYTPCINTAVRIKDNKNPDRDGDIEFELLNYRNGTFRVL